MLHTSPWPYMGSYDYTCQKRVSRAPYRTARFEAPRVLETVQYMSRMKALCLLIPKVTLGSRIGGLDQKLWPLEVRSLFPSAEPQK